MFNWIFLGFLWALSGLAGWRIKVARYSGNKPTRYDLIMLLPCLCIGPINLLFAAIY